MDGCTAYILFRLFVAHLPDVYSIGSFTTLTCPRAGHQERQLNQHEQPPHRGRHYRTESVEESLLFATAMRTMPSIPDRII